MARSSAFWCFLVWAPGVLAQEIVQVQTPAGTMHELARVPAGYFTMGSAEGRADEQPVHQVYLDDFYIDRFEVNNDQYAAFLNDIGGNADGEGHLLFDLRDADAQIHYDERYAPIPGTEQRPVAEVSWYGARAYCTWAGMQLPTEAMWEKAARSTDGRIYPWGNSIDRSRANYGKEGCCRGDDSDGFFDSAPVGSYQRGISPYGAYDMGGQCLGMGGGLVRRGVLRAKPRARSAGAGRRDQPSASRRVNEQRSVSPAHHRPRRAAAFSDLHHRRISLRCARTSRHGSAARKLGTNQAHYRGRQCAMNRTIG